MPNSDPGDGFFYPILTLMIDSCNPTHHSRQVENANELFYTKNLFLAHRIKISDILSWDRKSYLPMLSYPGCHVRAEH